MSRRALAAVVLTVLGSRTAAADPVAVPVELGLGSVGTLAGASIPLLLLSGPCGLETTREGACLWAKPAAVGAGAAGGGGLGVLGGGAIFDQRGTAVSAFAGAAAGTALTASVWLLVHALDPEFLRSASTVAIIASALVLPSLGATIGYEASR